MTESMRDPGTEICIKILSEAFPGIEVTSEIPFDRPEEPMIQVSRTGGPETEFTSEPTMQVLVWGGSDAAASSMALTAIHAVKDAVLDHERLSHAECTEMSRDEWAAMGESRYRIQMKLVIDL